MNSFKRMCFSIDNDLAKALYFMSSVQSSKTDQKWSMTLIAERALYEFFKDQLRQIDNEHERERLIQYIAAYENSQYQRTRPATTKEQKTKVLDI